MAIDFDLGRWERVKQTWRRWWAGELDRPLIACAIQGRDPGRAEPKLPYHPFTAYYAPSVPAEAVVDRWDYELSKLHFVGDAFPSIWPNFGPGVMAAFMGARSTCGAGTVWFAPEAEREIADIRFTYDPENPCLRRVKDICRAAMDRWAGLVQVGMTDLGGNLDVLSTFRPGERLPLDLIDGPEHVKRLTWEAHDLWHRYYAEINSVLQPANPGYSAWDGAYSQTPYYMLQCDFCYMIGPKMFEEFVRPELAATCRRLDNCLYHLDGPGQVPHLDSLLAIEELGGIQWVPGWGTPNCFHWLDLYERILRAGKLAWLSNSHADIGIIDAIVKRVGSPKGLMYTAWETVADAPAVRAVLKRYGRAD